MKTYTKREKEKAYYGAMIRLVGELGPGPIRGAEIGVAVGMLSKRLLKAHSNLTLWMVDTWRSFDPESPYCKTNDMRSKLTDEQQQSRYEHILTIKEAFSPRAVICRGESGYWADVAKQTDPPKLFDFVFIDADHSYEGVTADLAAWWPLIKTGGIFCGHDYGSDKYPGVKRAVDEFSEGRDIVICTCNEPAQHVWYHFKYV